MDEALTGTVVSDSPFLVMAELDRDKTDAPGFGQTEAKMPDGGKDPEIFSSFFTIGLALGLIGWMGGIISSWSMFWFVFLSSVAIGAVLQFKFEEKRQEEQKKQEESDRRETARLVEQHLDVLARKKRTLVRIGDYGEVIDDMWRKEIKKFLALKLDSLTYARLGGNDKEAGSTLEGLVDTVVSEYIDRGGASSTDADLSVMDGIEYEGLCGEILEQDGWQVQRTPATGDHGVDLIAEKDGRRVAIQCKKYSSPVGNKAVQEAYSGMGFFDAHEAAVVSNATFTQAAQVAANKLNVSLLHHDQLKSL